MRLGIKPALFFARAVIFFLITYAFWLWKPVSTFYTQGLAMLVHGALYLTEISSDPYLSHVTRVGADGTAIFFQHRLFPQVQAPGIPAEWVQANLVLLIPLMLATPAPSWGAKAYRFVLAMVLAVTVQVIDIVITVKAFYSVGLGEWSFRYYSDAARWLYQLSDAFTQSMDTQLFPFMIWAGIHFRQLVGWPERSAPAASRAEVRRSTRGKKKVQGEQAR